MHWLLSSSLLYWQLLWRLQPNNIHRSQVSWHLYVKKPWRDRRCRKVGVTVENFSLWKLDQLCIIVHCRINWLTTNCPVFMAPLCLLRCPFRAPLWNCCVHSWRRSYNMKCRMSWGLATIQQNLNFECMSIVIWHWSMLEKISQTERQFQFVELLYQSSPGHHTISNCLSAEIH